MPNPTKYNDTLIRELLENLTKYDRNTACQMVGISRQTLYLWLKEGQQDLHEGRDTEKARLYANVERARSEYKRPVIDSMRYQGAHGNVAAGKMILQSDDRRTWGDNIVVQQELREMVDRLERNLPPDVFRQVMEALKD